MTNLPTLTGVRWQKRVRFSDTVKRILRSRFFGQRSFSSCRGPVYQTYYCDIIKAREDCSKYIIVPRERSKAMRRHRRYTQSSLTVAPQAAHATRVNNQIRDSPYKTQFCGAMHQEHRFVSFNASSLSCLLYTSPSPRDGLLSRMPSSA